MDRGVSRGQCGGSPEVRTPVVMKSSDFWVIKPCSLLRNITPPSSRLKNNSSKKQTQSRQHRYKFQVVDVILKIKTFSYLDYNVTYEGDEDLNVNMADVVK
jgi:hypothetical protein